MAGKPAYIAVDLARTAVAITGAPLQDATNYPASNVGDGILAKASRLQYNGGSFELHIDNSPWVNYDSVAVLNHSLRAGGTFNVNANTVTGGGSYIGFGTRRDLNMWVDVGTQTVNNFIVVELTQIVGANGEPVEVGEIVVGPRVVLPRAVFVGNNQGIDETEVNRGITNESLGLVEYDYELGSYVQFRLPFRFPRSEYAAFKAWHTAVGRDPFVYIPDVNQPDAYYVKKDRGFNPKVIGRAMDGAVMDWWYDWATILRVQSYGISTG